MYFQCIDAVQLCHGPISYQMPQPLHELRKEGRHILASTPEQTSRSNLREVGDPKRRENIELQIVSFLLETQEKQTVEFGDQNGAFRAI